jgi:hypothetical protein
VRGISVLRSKLRQYAEDGATFGDFIGPPKDAGEGRKGGATAAFRETGAASRKHLPTLENGAFVRKYALHKTQGDVTP